MEKEKIVEILKEIIDFLDKDEYFHYGEGEYYEFVKRYKRLRRKAMRLIKEEENG